MLTCQQLAGLVTEYLDGSMPLVRRAQFQMHIGICKNCRAYLQQMKMTVRTLGQLPADPVAEMSPQTKAELLQRLRSMGAKK